LLLLQLLRLLLLMPDRLVLFVCVENAARSLIAEAAFNSRPPSGWHATSAGTRPAAVPHRRTRSMLEEVGLELPPHPPQLLSEELADRAQVRVTMGCLDDASCPVHLKMLELRDWGLEDPTTLDDDGFRRVRDRIIALVGGLQAEMMAVGPGRATPKPAPSP
jgi:arsenate reductase (thioredoxin)